MTDTETKASGASRTAAAHRRQALAGAIDAGDADAVAQLLDGAAASAIADALEAMEHAPRRSVWRQIKPGCRGEVLVELHGEVRRQLIESASADELVEAVAPLDLDALSDIDADLPPGVLDRVLAGMHPKRRRRFDLLRTHPDDTAGGLMDADSVAVRPGDTLAQAAQAMRHHCAEHGKLPAHLDTLMVTDEDNRYLGRIDVADLLVHATAHEVRAHLRTEPGPIDVAMPADDVARRFGDLNLVSSAVVDEGGRLLGRITVDDIVDVLRRQAERSQLANTGLDEETDTFAPLLVAGRQRALWLGVNLCNALVAAWIISLFEVTIDQMVALAVLMPVVASMGGVAGTQSLALAIRAIALDQLRPGTRGRLLRREMAIGGLNALLWAGVVAAVALAWFGNAALAGVFALAVVLNLLAGVFSGTLIPMGLARLGVDPALAGGVVLVALTDAFGFGVFLGLGSWLLL